MRLLPDIMTLTLQEVLATILEPFGLPLTTLQYSASALPLIVLQGNATMVIAIPPPL
jgi:urea transporter